MEWDGTVLKVWVHEAAAAGAANTATLRIVADWLGVAPSRLQILTGRTSRLKVIGIADGATPN